MHEHDTVRSRWNYDLKTGVETLLGFGKVLDCRNPQRVGDIDILETLALPAGRLCEHLEGNHKGGMTVRFTARREGAR